MKNKKIKIAYLLTTFIFLFTYIGGLLGNIKSYAYDDTYVALVSTTKPSSGSFKSSTKSSTKNYSTKPKSTIKPDSGSFSTKPNTSTNNSGSSSTIKPDSGSFSTTPKNNNSNSSNNNTNTNNDYDDYGGSTSKKSIFGGSYYGGYSPFRRVYFGYGISSWIMKLVMLITVIVVIYIIIDDIRSKRD